MKVKSVEKCQRGENFLNSVKLLLSLFLFSFSYFTLGESSLPTRATTDERLVFPDILYMFVSGQFRVPKYFSGYYYQVFSSSILRFSGLSPDSLQWVSPAIASVVAGLSILVLYKLFSLNVTSLWWGFALPAVSVFIFPGFVFRLWETTHKSLTFSLVFISAYLSYRVVESRSLLLSVLLVVTLLSVGSLNYLWGFIYSGFVSLFLLFNINKSASRAIFPAIAGMISLLSPAVSPITSYHTAYYKRAQSQFDKLRGLLLGWRDTAASSGAGSDRETGNTGERGTTEGPTNTGNQTTDGNTTGGNTSGGTVDQGPDLPEIHSQAVEFGQSVGGFDRIRLWSTIELLGFGFSSWFLYSAGIGFVAAITAISGLFAVSRVVRRRSDTMDTFALATFVYFGALGAGLLAIGDVATFKRIIVLPGIFGVLYASVNLDALRFIPRVQPRSVAAIVLVVLLVTSGLATNRLPTGGDQPTDDYLNPSEASTVQWVVDNSGDTDCIVVQQDVMTHYYQKIQPVSQTGKIRSTQSDLGFTNAIYDGGTGKTVGCLG